MKFLRVIGIILFGVMFQPNRALPAIPEPPPFDAPDLGGSVPPPPPGDVPDLGGSGAPPPPPPGGPDIAPVVPTGTLLNFKSIGNLNKYLKALGPIFTAFFTTNVLDGLSDRIANDAALEKNYKEFKDAKTPDAKAAAQAELKRLFDQKTPIDILAAAHFKLLKILGPDGKLTSGDEATVRNLIKASFEIFVQENQKGLADYFDSKPANVTQSYLGIFNKHHAQYKQASPILIKAIFDNVGKLLKASSVVFANNLLALDDLKLIAVKGKPTDEQSANNQLKKDVITKIKTFALWASPDKVNAWIVASNKAWNDIVTPPKKGPKPTEEPIPGGITFDADKAEKDWYAGMASATDLGDFTGDVKKFVYSLQKLKTMAAKDIGKQACKYILNTPDIIPIPAQNQILDTKIVKFLELEEKPFSKFQTNAIDDCFPKLGKPKKGEPKVMTIAVKIHEYIDLSSAGAEAAKAQKAAEDKAKADAAKPKGKILTAEELAAEMAAQAAAEEKAKAEAPAKTPSKAPAKAPTHGGAGGKSKPATALDDLKTKFQSLVGAKGVSLTMMIKSFTLEGVQKITLPKLTDDERTAILGGKTISADVRNQIKTAGTKDLKEFMQALGIDIS